MKVCIVAYYELKDALQSAANALRKLGYTVVSYPLFRMAYDINDKCEDYVERFNRFIKDEDPQVLLWWFVNIPVSKLTYIRENHPHRFFVWYNWDDPWVWFEQDMKVEEKCHAFDLVAASSCAMLDRYQAAGAKDAIYLSPGFDPAIHRPIPDKYYKYDASFCCTNLYTDEKYFDQFIPRKQLIDDVVADNEINFALFGPAHLKPLYPKHYKGLIPYKETNTLFNVSRINFCTHVCHSHKGYLNERTVLVMGSGGLLLVDPVCQMEEKLEYGQACVVLDKTRYMEQIKSILKNYDRYTDIKRYGHAKAMKQFTWDVVMKEIGSRITRHFFDPEYYRKEQHLEITDEEELWQHWLVLGDKDIQPFPLIARNVKKKVYTPRAMFGDGNGDGDANVDFVGWCRINEVLGRIEAGNELALKDLEQAIVVYPLLNVNSVIESYFANSQAFNSSEH